MSDEQETILLRGGPVNDRILLWRGGDEVRLPYMKDAFQPMERAQKAQRKHDYLVYRRSEDDPSRFDFVKII